jgi:hypothetical protein
MNNGPPSMPSPGVSPARDGICYSAQAAAYKLLINVAGFTFSSNDVIPEILLDHVVELVLDRDSIQNSTTSDVALGITQIFEACLTEDNHRIDDMNYWLASVRRLCRSCCYLNRDYYFCGGYLIRGVVYFYVRAWTRTMTDLSNWDADGFHLQSHFEPHALTAWRAVANWVAKFHWKDEETLDLDILHSTHGLAGIFVEDVGAQEYHKLENQHAAADSSTGNDFERSRNNDEKNEKNVDNNKGDNYSNTEKTIAARFRAKRVRRREQVQRARRVSRREPGSSGCVLGCNVGSDDDSDTENDDRNDSDRDENRMTASGKFENKLRGNSNNTNFVVTQPDHLSIQTNVHHQQTVPANSGFGERELEESNPTLVAELEGFQMTIQEHVLRAQPRNPIVVDKQVQAQDWALAFQARLEEEDGGDSDVSERCLCDDCEIRRSMKDHPEEWVF